MPIDQGPISWERYAPFARPPLFAGRPLSSRLATIRIDPAPSGIELPMLDGGSVFQVELLPADASLSRASSEITLTYAAATEEDSRAADLLGALCREDVQPVILWDVFSDYWRIGGTTRTSWGLSRESAPAPPDVHSGEIIAPDGSITALTLVSGTPDSGEIAVSGSTATTADLSGLAGSLLHVRYYPVRYVASITRSQDYSEAGLMTFDLTFREWLP